MTVMQSHNTGIKHVWFLINQLLCPLTLIHIMQSPICSSSHIFMILFHLCNTCQTAEPNDEGFKHIFREVTETGATIMSVVYLRIVQHFHRSDIFFVLRGCELIIEIQLRSAVLLIYTIIYNTSLALWLLVCIGSSKGVFS